MDILVKEKLNLKYSNVNWIGKIPSSWVVLPVRASLSERKEKNVDNHVTNILSVMKDVGVVRYEDKGNIGNKKSDRPEAYKVVYSGDIVANSMNLVIGSVGLSREIGVTSSVYLIYFAKNKDVCIEYFEYLFRTKQFQKHLALFGRGIMELRESIKHQDIKAQLVPTPPRETQQKIVDFLDKKTTNIDLLIAKKKKMVALLEEKRSSLITHAVTKGLNPHAKMKDSKLDLVGLIPESWNISPLGFLGSLQNGISAPGEYFGIGHPFISYGDAYKNESILEIPSGLANSSLIEQQRYSLKVNDVLFTRTSETIEEIGFSSVCYISIPKATFSGFLIRFRPKINILYKGFSKFYFRSFLHRSFFAKEMNIVTRASLGQDLLKKMPVILPNLDEQKNIANFLEHKTEKIDLMISKIKKQITLLNEYKQSLIYNAVTGKIKI